MDFQEILTEIGNTVSNFFNEVLTKISEIGGLNTENLSTKLLTIFILALLFYFGTKIANVTAKWILIIVSIVLAISVLFSLA